MLLVFLFNLSQSILKNIYIYILLVYFYLFGDTWRQIKKKTRSDNDNILVHVAVLSHLYEGRRLHTVEKHLWPSVLVSRKKHSHSFLKGFEATSSRQAATLCCIYSPPDPQAVLRETRPAVTQEERQRWALLRKLCLTVSLWLFGSQTHNHVCPDRQLDHQQVCKGWLTISCRFVLI